MYKINEYINYNSAMIKSYHVLKIVFLFCFTSENISNNSRINNERTNDEKSAQIQSRNQTRNANKSSSNLLSLKQTKKKKDSSPSINPGNNLPITNSKIEKLDSLETASQEEGENRV